MKEFRIAAIPGDGIGTEVVAAGIEVLEAVAGRDGGFRLSFDRFDWGSDYHRRHGEMMPRDGLDRIRGHDAILFGAIHLPNPILAPVTAVAGYIWCRLYEGSPNLFTLAASHAWLATMLMTHVPKVHRVMHLGPGYLAGQ